MSTFRKNEGKDRVKPAKTRLGWLGWNTGSLPYSFTNIREIRNIRGRGNSTTSRSVGVETITSKPSLHVG